MEFKAYSKITQNYDKICGIQYKKKSNTTVKVSCFIVLKLILMYHFLNVITCKSGSQI